MLSLFLFDYISPWRLWWYKNVFRDGRGLALLLLEQDQLHDFLVGCSKECGVLYLTNVSRQKWIFIFFLRDSMHFYENK